MFLMDFEEAYLTILKASKEKDSVEVPTILSCVDFSGKKCLEIGCGPLARLARAIAANSSVYSITCTENYDGFLKKAEENIFIDGYGDLIDVILNKEKTKLPFENNSFDVVYGAWLPHALVTDVEFLDELVRVSKKDILLVMPGIDDDLVEMKSIAFPGEKERREKYKSDVVSYLEGKGLSVSLKEADLKLDFDSFEDIKGVFDVFDFSKGYEGKEEEVDEFLKGKVHNMKNSFYCIIAEK